MDKQKSVLFLLHLPPPVHGSSMVGKYIWESSRVNGTFSCRHINLLASDKVKESGKVSLGKITGFIRIWVKLLRELLKQKPDLCYLALTVTGAAFYRDVLIVSTLKIFRVKRIYHLHNKGISSLQKHPFHRFFYRFVFKGRDVILLSKYLYPDVQAFVSEEKVHICPNGIPETKSRQKIEIKRQNAIVKVLFLSNLIESKGVFVLLEACSLLKRKGIPFQCDFVGGEGDLTVRQFQEKVKQLELTRQVAYLGKKYGREKELAFNEADIFAFPTHYPNECFPLVLLEAMQFELPVVSTTEGGIRDIIEDGKTGFLVPQTDAGSLAQKLETLIINPDLRRKMGEAGRQKYEQELTLKKFENRLTAILIEIIQSNIPGVKPVR